MTKLAVSGEVEVSEVLSTDDSLKTLFSTLMRIHRGELKHQVDLQEGFENIPDTLNRLFTGKNLGKQLLKIADPQ